MIIALQRFSGRRRHFRFHSFWPIFMLSDIIWFYICLDGSKFKFLVLWSYPQYTVHRFQIWKKKNQPLIDLARMAMCHKFNTKSWAKYSLLRIVFPFINIFLICASMSVLFILRTDIVKSANFVCIPPRWGIPFISPHWRFSSFVNQW